MQKINAYFYYLFNKQKLLNNNALYINIVILSCLFCNDILINKSTYFTIINSYLCSMRVDILTIHPELLKSPFEHSILKRAIEKNLVQIELHDIRPYSTDKHRKVDDYQFGGGAGMVMTIQPIADCIKKLNPIFIKMFIYK